MKIVTILGARPQFIKAGSVSREIRRRVMGHTLGGPRYRDVISRHIVTSRRQSVSLPVQHLAYWVTPSVPVFLQLLCAVLLVLGLMNRFSTSPPIFVLNFAGRLDHFQPSSLHKLQTQKTYQTNLKVSFKFLS